MVLCKVSYLVLQSIKSRLLRQMVDLEYFKAQSLCTLPFYLFFSKKINYSRKILKIFSGI
jgi:hypothetical protein